MNGTWLFCLEEQQLQGEQVIKVGEKMMRTQVIE